jgi:hypothetical protein
MLWMLTGTDRTPRGGAFGHLCAASSHLLTAHMNGLVTVGDHRARFKQGHVDGRGQPDSGRPDAGCARSALELPTALCGLGAL